MATLQSDRADGRAHRDLVRALGLHVLFLPVWGFWALVAAFGSPSSRATAFWVVGAIWLLVGVLVVIWWNEGRVDLPGRVLVWACCWWLALAFFPLLLISGFRRGFVPPLPAAAGLRQADGTSGRQAEPQQRLGWRSGDFLLAAIAAVALDVPVGLATDNVAVDVVALVAVFLLALPLARRARLRRVH